MQDASLQQVDVRPPIHLVLEELQAVDLPLCLPVAPFVGERHSNRFVVLMRPCCKPSVSATLLHSPMSPVGAAVMASQGHLERPPIQSQFIVMCFD